MGRDPDDQPAARPAADFGHRQVVLAHMDAVRAAGQGYVQIVVDDEGHPVPVAEGADLPGFVQEGGFVQLLFPQLDAGDASLQGGFHLLV